MIQRIQTLYLAVMVITSGILPFVFPLWKENKMEFYFMQDMKYVALFGLGVALAVWSITNFKKRQQQFVLNRLNIILNLILLGLFVYRSLTLSGESFEIGRASCRERV